jgi:hypothetical protein
VRRLAAAALAALLLPVPAAGADSDTIARIRTIAVVSMIPDNLVLATIGGTRFDSSARALPAGWDVQGVVARRADAVLRGRYAVRSIALPMDTFDNLQPGWFGDHWETVGERIRALPLQPGIDAYLVVFPTMGLDRNDKTRGMFLYHDAGLLAGKGTVALVPYIAVLFDSVTGQRLGLGKGEIPESGTITGYGTPSDQCSDALWAGEGDPDGAQTARLRVEMLSLIERSLPFAIANAGLISENDAKATLASAGPGDAACHKL